MNISIDNYFSQYPQLANIINQSPKFKEAHDFVVEATNNGSNFDAYNAAEEISATINLYFQKLQAEFEKSDTPVSKAKGGKDSKGVKKVKVATEPKKATVKIKSATNAETRPSKTAIKPKGNPDAEIVEHIPSDIALVKKYIAVDGKTKSFDQILSLWRAFEKATIERKVTKNSPHRIAINTMKASLQSALVKSEIEGQLKLSIDPISLKEYIAIAESVEKSASVSMLLEFINISGKAKVQERAMKLSKRMSKALSSGALDNDRYKSEVESALIYIEAYLDNETSRIELKDNALSGLGEIAIMGCTCNKGLSGMNRSQNAVILQLIQARVKSLDAPELNRAFKDTVAPSICKLIAKKLIQAGQLSMAIIRNPAQPNMALSGVPIHNSFNTEILDYRMKQAAQKQMGRSHSKGLSGFDEPIVSPKIADDTVILSAQQIMNMKFRTIGLTGKYRSLIGDPEPAFSAMIYGKPKQGKSTVAIDMAKELTKLGKVLYCAFEEGHGGTLQDKIKRNNANVPGLDFANKLPANLNAYQFVFIDSVSDAGLDEAFFKALIKANKPNTSIVGIFHATKDGKFRGGQTFAHDVDVLMRVENGVVYAQGRYAPQGEMRI